MTAWASVIHAETNALRTFSHELKT